MAPGNHDTAANKQPTNILVVDVGTTTIRSYIYDNTARIVGSSVQKVNLLRPQTGWVEIEPEELWQQVQQVIAQSLLDADLVAANIRCIGITAHRGSFIVWNRSSGDYYHNFITWQDKRAADLVDTWNKSWKLFWFNFGSWFLYKISGVKRYLAGSVFIFRLIHATLRLKWMFNNDKKLWQDAKNGDVCFATINTWLLWKLTGQKVFATNYSFASSTGMYDPFQMEWSGLLAGLVNYPTSIFPPIFDDSGYFGDTDPSLFGSSIPILAVMADQQSGLFGQCCFKAGDMKCTLGTGGFMQVNTGNEPHQSIQGLYPLIGWKIGKEIVYVVEGVVSDLGRCLEWLKDFGIVDHVSEIDEMVKNIEETGGVYFVPAFSGLQSPIDDDYACTSLVGMTTETRKEHIARAVVNGIAYRLLMLYNSVLHEYEPARGESTVKIDGGVSGSTYLMQMLSDTFERVLDLPENTEMASLGVAFMAGLYAGVWPNREVVRKLRVTRKQYTPETHADYYKAKFSKWKSAMARSKSWYNKKEFQMDVSQLNY